MSSMDSKPIVPLAVPYAQKDHFKQKYGPQFLWNPARKFWYWFGAAPLPEDLQPFLPATPVPAESPPSDSKPRLTLELIPKTCWKSSIRKRLSAEQWAIVRKHTFSAAHHVCEICGGRGDTWPVECHETYQYDEAAKIQKLLAFRALCPACRLVKQYGLEESQGREQKALDQLCQVNRWTEGHARKYVDEQFELWERRSRIKWAMDFSY